jgi:hypothetical protein
MHFSPGIKEPVQKYGPVQDLGNTDSCSDSRPSMARPEMASAELWGFRARVRMD